MGRNYFRAKAIVDQWNAQSLSAVIPNDASPIMDGADTDGRSLITGANVTNIITRAMEVIADYEAGSNAKLNTVLKVAVNPQ